MTPDLFLRATALGKKSRGRRRLEALSIDITAGVHGVVGRNGSGKSTLLRILAGRERPDSGTVVFGTGIKRVDVGFLPQHFTAPPSLTVEELARYARFLRFGRKGASDVGDALAAVAMLHVREVPVARLSGGEQRRAAIAAVLATEPKLILLDEPTAGLDPEQRKILLDSIVRMKNERAVVFTTHLASDLANVCDSVRVLEAGRIVFEGAVADLVALGEGDPDAGLLKALRGESAQ